MLLDPAVYHICTSKHWYISLKSHDAETMQLTVHEWSLQAFNVFTDVLFATLPIPIIWRLQMKTKVRLYLIGVLSLGYT
jgi:hypothetical protein